MYLCASNLYTEQRKNYNWIIWKLDEFAGFMIEEKKKN